MGDLGMLAYSTGHTLLSQNSDQGFFCDGCRYYFHTMYSIKKGRWRCPNCLEKEIRKDMK